jgi:hypothetical protein
MTYNKDHPDIDRIAFTGRTYFEYIRKFDLDASLLRRGPILDCAGGPSSFMAEAHQRNRKEALARIKAAAYLPDSTETARSCTTTGMPSTRTTRGRLDLDGDQYYQMR